MARLPIYIVSIPRWAVTAINHSVSCITRLAIKVELLTILGS